MDQIPFAALQAPAKFFPNQPLEERIGKGVERGVDGPSRARAAAQFQAELPGELISGLSVERGHGCAPQSALLDGHPVAFLGDEMHVRHLGQRARVMPADERHTDALGVRRLGNEQNAGFVGLIRHVVEKYFDCGDADK